MNEPSKHLIEHALNAATAKDAEHAEAISEAIAAARAQLAKTDYGDSREERDDGDHLASLILEVLGEEP